MNIYLYLAGVLSGVSVAGFFLGKELYRFYIKNKIQKKQLDRMNRLLAKVRRTKEFSNS